MNEKFVNSEEYLNKINRVDLEKPEEELEESVLRLAEPFKDIVDNGEGNTEIKTEDMDIQINYSNSSPDGRMRKINHLIFKIKDKGFDLIDILPNNTEIIYDRETGGYSGDVQTPNEEGIRKAIITTNLNSPLAFSILFHEVGHLIDYKKLDDLEITTLMDEHKDSDIAEEIRKERFANAFALKIMRPYLNTQTREDMINILKYISLKGYYNKAKNDLKGRNEKF